MIKAVLFPSEVFSIKEVDSCFESEFNAAKENGNFEIYFYDYEEFVSSGVLLLNRKPQEKTLTVLRGWMLKNDQYKDFHNKLLEKNIELITSPDEYSQMHLFPYIYPRIIEDTPKILSYPENVKIDLSEIKSTFKRFMIKDFVKSEKGTDFPKYFDSSITENDFEHYLKMFKEYRGKLFTIGYCFKEFVDLKKYNNHTNEWRVFYLNGKAVSVCQNSEQENIEAKVPENLVEKYKNLPSPFYTIDFAELEDGSWKILETGDGQVSGLSKNQDISSFFQKLFYYEKDLCLDCLRKEKEHKSFCPTCSKIATVSLSSESCLLYSCSTCGTCCTTFFSKCELLASSCQKNVQEYLNENKNFFKKGKNCPYN